jgi:FKBP-type peptidyl-prolyl cis-trans isomerase
MKQLIFSLLVLALGLASCKVESEQDRINTRADLQIQQYITAQKLSLQKSATGLYYSIQPGNVANARTPKDLEEVGIYQVTYRTVDGLVIDSTEKSKQEPEYFIFHNGARIAGIEEALTLMKEGDKATLIIPPALAFGANSLTKLPPNSVIRMDIQLVSTTNEEDRILNYIAKNKLVVTAKTDTVRVVNLKTTADTNKIINGKTVRINYTGRLLRNVRRYANETPYYLNQFDTGTLDVLLGGNKVVAGFEAGIKKMKLGEKGIILFPSVYGYGGTGSSPKNTSTAGIPAYSPLSFEIELVSIVK